MEALLKIRTKDGNEVSKSNFNDVLSKKKKQPKPPKAPNGVVAIKKNGDFAKFIPIPTSNTPAPPVPWDDENTEDLKSAVDFYDDGKFDTENDTFVKQDREWHELMKELGAVDNDDVSPSDNDDDAPSSCTSNDISSEANFDDDNSDVSNIGSDLEDGDIFYNYTIKETKVMTKSAEVYSGIRIDFDNSEW